MSVAAAATVLDSVSRPGGGVSLRDRIPRNFEGVNDELEPFAFLLAARALSAVLGLGTIVLTGLLAERLVPGAGAVAALLAALVPALALRGSIATVDSYATVAVLICLYLTNRSANSARPYLVAFAAGAFAGVAFASKYPSVLVVVAFAATTLLLPAGLGERMARLGAGAVGVLAGALVAMPAFWRHPFEVFAGLKEQRLWYSQLAADPSLWRQAVVRAESTLGFAGPELGIVFLALTVLGLGIALRHGSLAPTVAGWCVFAGASFVLYSAQRYRPFRNLMPLVPIGCIAAAVGYRWIRDRISRPRWLDAGGGIALLVLFIVPMATHVRDRMNLVDPRRQAIDWVAARSHPGDGIAYLQELVILDSELKRLPTERWPVSADDADAVIRARSPRFVVVGIVAPPGGTPIDLTALPVLHSEYRSALRAGTTPTVPIAGWWRGNDQIVAVWERGASPPERP
jgi:Dolichyl-phosphate-mannose-protein mannosyltransferase